MTTIPTRISPRIFVIGSLMSNLYLDENWHPCSPEHARTFTAEELRDPATRERAIAVLGDGAQPFKIARDAR